MSLYNGSTAAIAAVLLCCGSAAAQVTHQPAFTVFGTYRVDQLGRSAAAAGDVNNDGVADFIVGSTGFTETFAKHGRATVFSGVDGSVLHVFDGDADNDEFGIDVGGVGDVNGDGYDDVIVGATKSLTSDIGYARVYSGADGSVLFSKSDGGVGARFGTAVSGVGDINGDGTPDFAVGAPDDSSLARYNGSVHVYSGATGGILYHFRGVRDDTLGYDIAGIGDVNGDGRDDFIAGGPSHVNQWQNTSGAVWVYSGMDGSVLQEIEGMYGNSFYGATVGAAGDVNGDGTPDFIVGAQSANIRGAAVVYSGADWSRLHEFVGSQQGEGLGRCVDGAGDVDGDGHADLIVGATGATDNSGIGERHGAAVVFSGANGSELYRFYGDDPDDHLGESVCGLGDLNGDGYADFLAGAPRDDDIGDACGSVRVYTSGFLACNAADLVEPWGLLDLADIVAFITGFVGHDPIADLDGNGVFDIGDVNIFTEGFTSGCPGRSSRAGHGLSRSQTASTDS